MDTLSFSSSIPDLNLELEVEMDDVIFPVLAGSDGPFVYDLGLKPVPIGPPGGMVNWISGIFFDRDERKLFGTPDEIGVFEVVYMGRESTNFEWVELRFVITVSPLTD